MFINSLVIFVISGAANVSVEQDLNLLLAVGAAPRLNLDLSSESLIRCAPAAEGIFVSVQDNPVMHPNAAARLIISREPCANPVNNKLENSATDLLLLKPDVLYARLSRWSQEEEDSDGALCYWKQLEYERGSFRQISICVQADASRVNGVDIQVMETK